MARINNGGKVTITGGYLLMETGHPYIQYFRDLREARAFITRYPTMGDAVRAGRVHLHQIGETISPDWVDGTGVSADRGRQT